MKRIFHLDNLVSDTYMREVLDTVEPSEISRLFNIPFNALQRSKKLEGYEFDNGAYLVAMDGTGFFSSNCPEPIIKKDGSIKNDCERNAGKRLIPVIKATHPKLKLIFTEDGLSSNTSNIRLLQEHGYGYILGAKPKDHKHLFEMARLSSDRRYVKIITEDKTTHEFYYTNDLPLNEENDRDFQKNSPDNLIRVSFLEYIETTAKGKVTKWSWVTSIHLTENTVFKVMRGGRIRWRIENETFNTLKNQGYQF